MLKYTFYAKFISVKLFSRCKKITGLEEQFHSKSCFFQHKIVFSSTSHMPSLHLQQKYDCRQPKKKKKKWLFHNCIFSQNTKMLLLTIMPSWQIYNQGVNRGRKATRKHISLALEVHLLITNTEFAKSPYYYLSHTTIPSGNTTQKKLMKKTSREI